MCTCVSLLDLMSKEKIVTASPLVCKIMKHFKVLHHFNNKGITCWLYFSGLQELGGSTQYLFLDYGWLFLIKDSSNMCLLNRKTLIWGNFVKWIFFRLVWKKSGLVHFQRPQAQGLSMKNIFLEPCFCRHSKATPFVRLKVSAYVYEHCCSSTCKFNQALSQLIE